MSHNFFLRLLLNNFFPLFFLQIQFTFLGLALCDVSHLKIDSTTESYRQPIPYHFQYEAGRYPGHVDSKYLIL